jgi:UDP-N-acetylmuramoyl-L-alanyl-D-glutamate--2,6-diaminopimelate ligase
VNGPGRVGPKSLVALLDGFVDLADVAERQVCGLSLDSRRVSPGDLFLACGGSRARGHDFVAEAVRAGAVAVAYEVGGGPRPEGLGDVSVVGVCDLRARAGIIAARFYGEPSRSVRVVGITGTNGKTSCSHLLAQAMARETATGVIGTLGYGLCRQGRITDLRATGYTTPDAVTINALLAEMRAGGATHVFMEVSSHALAQARVNGLSIDSAVFTNLTRDHLDYHADVDAYAAAKELLFRHPGLRRAVINLDDARGRRFAAALAHEVQAIGYGVGQRPGTLPEVWGCGLQLGFAGLKMRVHTPWGEADLVSPLLGRFNAHNLLAALSVLLLQGVPLAEGVARLGRVGGVPGRMERFVSGPGRPVVVVDYAHTPDALDQALTALRPHCGGRLWCIFGCGGERDTGKRPLMGAVAEALADVVVLTDDNPRGEEGDAIIADILSGMARPGAARVERARDQAIARAIEAAGEADVVLVAGKGHEVFQEVGERRMPFSDRDYVQGLGFRAPFSRDVSPAGVSRLSDAPWERKVG